MSDVGNGIQAPETPLGASTRRGRALRALRAASERMMDRYFDAQKEVTVAIRRSDRAYQTWRQVYQKLLDLESTSTRSNLRL